MSKQTNSKTIKTSIGGQAVIEGVMMRGPKLTALSVRMPDQSISTETWDTPNSNKWYKKTPFIRGVFNFVESLTDGYKSLMKAAEKAGLDDEEEEPSKFEQKLRQLLGDKFMPFLQGCILLFSLAMALFFFAFLPTTLVGFFKDYINHPLALSALEGLTKIAILILYLALISNMSDIKRVFMYHGAEHKTIYTYEHGLPLVVENVRPFSTLHPRCGTNFLMIVMLISIFIFAFLGWPSLPVRIMSRIVLMPVVAGISYEIIRYAGNHIEHPWVRRAILPGLLLQKLTTREPDDSQIEVAIASLKAVLPPDESHEQE